MMNPLPEDSESKHRDRNEKTPVIMACPRVGKTTVMFIYTSRGFNR